MATNKLKGVRFNVIEPSGIWNSIGCPVNEEQTVQIYIEDTDKPSLADLCGFEKTNKPISVISDQKEISELVVLLPFTGKEAFNGRPPSDLLIQDYNLNFLTGCLSCGEINCTEFTKETHYGDNAAAWIKFQSQSNYAVIETDVKNDFTNTSGLSADFLSGLVGEEYKLSTNSLHSTTNRVQNKRYKNGLVTSFVEDGNYFKTEKYFFEISEKTVNDILGAPDYRRLNIGQIKDILDNKLSLDPNNNVVKLMRMMTKYNFPSHLNWLLRPELPRYVMYVEEFKYILNKEEISNIWQGTMPDIAMNPEDDVDHVIEHFLTEDEIFGGYDINKFNIKMKVFKIKLRAKNSYKKDVVKNYTVTDDTVNIDKWYTPNWPYDFFSLIELLRIEAGEVRDYTAEFQLSGSDETTVTVTQNSDGTTSVSTTRVGFNNPQYVTSEITNNMTNVNSNMNDNRPGFSNPIK